MLFLISLLLVLFCSIAEGCTLKLVLALRGGPINTRRGKNKPTPTHKLSVCSTTPCSENVSRTLDIYIGGFCSLFLLRLLFIYENWKIYVAGLLLSEMISLNFKKRYIHCPWWLLTANLSDILSVTLEDPIKEVADLMENTKEEGWEKSQANKQVTFVVYREGDQLNFFRVVDRGDGTLTPLSESLRFETF